MISRQSLTFVLSLRLLSACSDTATGTHGAGGSYSGGTNSGGSDFGGTNSGGSDFGGSISGSDGGGNDSAGAGAGPGHSYPDRFGVGAPGVGVYRQSDARLPVPAGYTEVMPTAEESNEWDLYDCDGVVTLDHMYFHAFIYIGTGCHGTVNITNSIIAPPPGTNQRSILVNADASAALRLNISSTTIRPEPVPMGGTNAALTDHAVNGCETCTIHMDRVDIANSGGMCLCGENLTIENSWLHDNYVAHLADPSLAHTGGVFPYGGSGPLTIRNNRMEPGIDAFTGIEVPSYWLAITAVLFTQSNGGSTLRNYTVEGNFISLGAYDFDAQDGADLVVRNNVFGPNHFGYTSSVAGVTYADWSNNVVGDIAGNPTGPELAKP
jgi:hypothetical protein